MAEAADLFCNHRITGAPVIDECGRCVGVLSATDFVHLKAEELCNRESKGDFVFCRDAMGTCSFDEVRHDLVRQHMTPAVQTISADAPLSTAGDSMCRMHVHRLIVLDERGAPVGILTSLDLVRALLT